MTREPSGLPRLYWASLGAAWLSLLLGMGAFVLAVTGYSRSLPLSTAPRPNVGIGLSEAANMALGSAYIGWFLAAAGVLFAALGVLVPGRRRFKIVLSIPALVYAAAPLIAPLTR